MEQTLSTRKEYSDRIEWTNEQGQFHREDGPAREYNDGYKAWYLNGERHREDGPAIVMNDGRKWWYLNDIKYSEQEYKKELIKLKLKRIENL